MCFFFTLSTCCHLKLQPGVWHEHRYGRVACCSCNGSIACFVCFAFLPSTGHNCLMFIWSHHLCQITYFYNLINFITYINNLIHIFHQLEVKIFFAPTGWGVHRALSLNAYIQQLLLWSMQLILISHSRQNIEQNQLITTHSEQIF